MPTYTETIKPTRDTIIIDAQSYSSWKIRHHNETKTIQIAETSQDDQQGLMIGTSISQPQTDDEHTLTALQTGTENVLFTNYGSVALDGQKEGKKGRYAVRLNFILGVLTDGNT